MDTNHPAYTVAGGKHAAEKLMVEEPIFSMGYYEDDNEMRDVLAVIAKCERCGMTEAAKKYYRYWGALCAKNGRRSIQYGHAIAGVSEQFQNFIDKMEDKIKDKSGKESNV